MELLEIEKVLKGEAGAAALARYDGVLLSLSGRLEEAMRQGLPPAEYPRCEALGPAITVARKLLRLQMRDSGISKAGREAGNVTVK